MRQRKNNILNRICPICQLPLKVQDFNTQNQENPLELWNNKILAIPCCRCYEILKKLTESNVLKLEYHTEISQAWVILNSLFKFGFITEQKRNEEFKAYRDHIKYLNQRKIRGFFFE